MPLYRLTETTIEALGETTPVAQGLKERGDLQRLLRANIAAVAPDVLVIAEEFAEWEGSKRRIDLLGVDRNANLVVIELKRDEDGGHMELQAIRYAAMVSSMTFARAVDAFQAFLDRAGPGGDAKAVLLKHLGWAEPREEDFATDVRILLVSADFSKEVTTAVLWLNERDLDIRCVRLRLYTLGGEVVVDAQQVIPLPEAHAYIVHLKQKGQVVRQEKQGKANLEVLRLEFWKELLPVAAKVTPRFAGIGPSDDHWISAATGVPGLRWEYLVWQDTAGCEVYIDKGTGSAAWNKAVFDYLHQRQEPIERAYGKALSWHRLDDKRASRVMDESVPGGIRSPREQWPQIAAALVDAMQRIYKALTPHMTGAVAAANAAAPVQGASAP